MKKVIHIKNLNKQAIEVGILKVVFPVVLCLAIFQSYGQWTQSEFVIGTFWDPRFTSTTDTNNVNAATDIARMVEAKNAYFNLCTGTGENADCGWHVTGGMQYGLFLASHAGLKYMSTDLGYWNCPAFDAPTAATIITSYSNGLSAPQRRAFYGYHIKDEPILTDETNLKSWLNYLKINDLTKLSYFNLMPRYYYAAGAAGDIQYDTYLNTFLNDVNASNRPDVVAFDNYPILSGPTYRTDYFYNLDIIRTKCGTRPFWCYPMTTQSSGYQLPDVATIRFSDFCPLAYGAKGLIYFTYVIPTTGGPWAGSLIDASNNQTSTYNIVKPINQYISNLVGPMIMNSTSIGAYHKSTSPTGEVISASQMLSSCSLFLNSSLGLANNNLLAGVFQDKIDLSRYHGLIVNKNISSSVPATVVTLQGNYSPTIYLAPSVVGYTGSTCFEAVTATYASGSTTFTLPSLAAGEGRLFTTSVPIISSTTVSKVTCSGGSDGSVTVTASGGTGSLQYSNDNGMAWQSSNVFSGLTAGSYTLRVKDENNFEFAYTSNPVVIGTAVPIYGSSNPCQGSIAQNYTVTNTDGVTYSWTVPPDWTITSGQGTNSMNATVGAISGNVTVSLNNGCGSGTLPVDVTGSVPSQPSVIAGSTAPCSRSVMQNYSVTNVAGVTYTWSVPFDWSITEGQGTNSIYVCVGASTGNITVTPSNGCGIGIARTLVITSISNSPGQPSAITGVVAQTPYSAGQVYSVTNDGYSYTWSLPSDWTITSGQGTYSITVTTGTISGNISVIPSNECGNGPVRTLAVSTTSGIVKTRVTSGNWNTAATWIQVRTGTSKFTSGSKNVTGTGTRFLTELKVGDVLMLDATSGTIRGTVASITSNTALTLVANASATIGPLAYGRQIIPSPQDDVQIGNANIAGTTTITIDVTPVIINSLTFLSRATADVLNQSNDFNMNVNGNIIINQPTAAVTNVWNINAGTATVGGLISFPGSTATSNYISKIAITSGILNANGGINFSTAASANKIIDMSGGSSTGTLNMKGTLTVPSASSTLLAGSSGSNFNYCDNVNSQSVNYFSAGAYNNLIFNNTSNGGATLSADINTSNVTGNISVQSGILNNGGYAITLNTMSFSVSNGASFNLSGTTTMATGTSTKTFGSSSTIDYNGTNQTVTSETYGNLTLSISGTKTLPATTTTVIGDLTTSGAIVATAGASINIGGNLLLGTGTTFNGGSYIHTIGANWINNGTFTPSTSTINFNKTGMQIIGGSSTTTFNNLVLSGSGVKNIPGSIINGILSLEGTATVDGNTPSYGSAATLQYKGSTAQTTGIELPVIYTGSGGIIIDNANGVTLTKSTELTFGLNIISGAFTVNPMINLTVGGSTNLGNSQSLVIKSNASGSASFIDNCFSGSGTANVERWVSTNGTNRWEYVSSPVTLASSSLFTSASHALYYADETNNAWVSIPNASPTNMSVMLGYARKYVNTDGDGDVAKTFIGTLNTGAQSIGLTRTESAPGAQHGWNLVGNPYPSSMDWNAASGWTKTNIDNAIYFRTNGNYGSYVSGVGTNGGTQYIPPMQAFWVRVSSGNTIGNLSCNNNVRVHNNHNIYKTTSLDNTLHITATNNANGLTDDTYVRFNQDATDDFDSQYDAYKIFAADSTYPQIYTNNGTDDISINSLSELTSERTVLLGFKTTISGQYTITADMVSSFTNNGNTVYLEDIQNGILQDLSANNTYQFTSGVTTGLTRFVLHFNPTITNITEDAKTGIVIFSSNNEVHLCSMKMLDGDVSVYDMLGQIVAARHLSGSTSCIINLESKCAVYIVKYTTSDQTLTRRIFINQ